MQRVRTAKGLGRAKLVGREAEMAALDAALSRAARFKAPQAVTVIGALGLGKTRLVDEWLASKVGAGVRVVRAAAQAVGDEQGQTAPPRALIAALLRDRFNLGREADPAAALSGFRAELQRVFG